MNCRDKKHETQILKTRSTISLVPRQAEFAPCQDSLQKVFNAKEETGSYHPGGEYFIQPTDKLTCLWTRLRTQSVVETLSPQNRRKTPGRVS